MKFGCTFRDYRFPDPSCDDRGQQGTAGASLILKKIIAANAANFAETEDHQFRVWILPLEYVLSSLELEELLDPEENDLELTVAHMRQARADELAEERKANGGKSKYAPGERKKIENEKKAKALEKQYVLFLSLFLVPF